MVSPVHLVNPVNPVNPVNCVVPSGDLGGILPLRGVSQDAIMPPSPGPPPAPRRSPNLMVLLTDPNTWISFVTLVALEIVWG